MKANRFIALTLLGLSTVDYQVSTSLAQTSTFTYQGRFTDNGAAFTGTAEFQFTLWDAASNGTQVATTPASSFISITNGLFTTPIDFGSAAFTGADRWIQIEARTTLGPFTTLQPRQKVAATPYAIRAANLSGTLGSNQLAGTYANAVTFSNAANIFTGTFTGSGATLSNVNATALSGLSANAFWQLSGNAGATPGTHFVGTTDNQALEFKVAGQRTLRLEPGAPTNSLSNVPVIYSNAPNVVAGSAVNIIDAPVNGGTIGGGGLGGLYADAGSGYIFLGAFSNRVSANFGTLSGGLVNAIHPNAFAATVGGGEANTIQMNAEYATIAGGRGNTVQTNARRATISGGISNTIQTNAASATIGGGNGNTIELDAALATIGGGSANRIEREAQDATIGGGDGNRIQALGRYSVIGGGTGNTIESAQQSAIGGGFYNSILTGANSATIGGGEFNTNGARWATVPGGRQNAAMGEGSFAAGDSAKALHNGSFVWSDQTGVSFSSTAPNQFLIRPAGGMGVGFNNPAAQLHVSNNGNDSFPVARFDQLTPGGYVQIRLTTGGDYNKRWDIAANTNRFLIYSGVYGQEMMVLDNTGLTVRGTFVSSSDRDAKENFQPVDPREVLDKVTALPITRWNYKQDAGTTHLGPMAQDFYSAFALGTDDKHIATVDADGVALAAIQGLNQKVNEEVTVLRAENVELKRRLEKLERFMSEKP